MISKIIAEDLISKTEKVIDNAEKIAIVAHVGPDGDALGSSLALWHYFRNIEKQSTIVLPSEFPEFLSWMPGAEHIIVYTKNKKQADRILTECDLLFALDFNTPSRLAEMAKTVESSSAKVVMIDHHLNPDTDFADIIISYPTFSSTSELVFRVICQMGYFCKINLACAECIYTGMMTDTGSFTYGSNNPEIYTIISELISIGIDKDEIYQKVYNTSSETKLRLMGFCVYQKLKIYSEYRTAVIALSKDELTQFDYKTGDIEGVVNIPLSVENVDLSILLREDKDKIKISFRSKGTFPANKVASDLFNGGGHLNASGAESYTSLNEAIKFIESALPEYKDFLLK